MATPNTNPYFYPALDEAITLHLRRYGMKQADLAAELDMSENTFSWKRRGIKDFYTSEIIKLCNILGIELCDAVVAS